jgi:hypothetical protein
VKATLRNVAIFALLSGAGWIARAQDAAPSTVDLQSPRDQPAVPAATPSNPPDVPELSKLDEAFKQTSLGQEADEIRMRVELRKLQNEAASDPAVIAAKSSAEAERTDLEKRQRLRDYYNLFYDRMRMRASGEEMRSVLDSQKSGHLKMLDQPRVRHATDGASPTPPSPEGKPKKPKKPKKQKKQKYFSRRLFEDHFESLRDLPRLAGRSCNVQRTSIRGENGNLRFAAATGTQFRAGTGGRRRRELLEVSVRFHHLSS